MCILATNSPGSGADQNKVSLDRAGPARTQLTAVLAALGNMSPSHTDGEKTEPRTTQPSSSSSSSSPLLLLLLLISSLGFLAVASHPLPCLFPPHYHNTSHLPDTRRTELQFPGSVCQESSGKDSRAEMMPQSFFLFANSRLNTYVPWRRAIIYDVIACESPQRRVQSRRQRRHNHEKHDYSLAIL